MWAAFSSTSPDIEGHKGVPVQEEERPGGERGRRKGRSESGRTLTGETPRRTKRRKNSARGTLIIEGVWGYDIEPYSIYQGEEEEVLL